MTKHTTRAGIAALALGALALLGMQAPAAANHCNGPYPSNPCEHPATGTGNRPASPATPASPAAGPSSQASPATPASPAAGANPSTPARPVAGTGRPQVAVSDSRPSRAGTVDVLSPGWLPRTSVLVEMRSTPVVLGTFMTNADGVLDATVTIPADAEPGAHSLVLMGIGADNQYQTVSTPLFVEAAATAPGAGAPGAGAPGAGAPGAGAPGAGAPGAGAPGAGAPGAGSGAGASGGAPTVAGVSLPRTGAEAALVAATGIALVAVGAASIYAGRRKRQLV